MDKEFVHTLPKVVLSRRIFLILCFLVLISANTAIQDAKFLFEFYNSTNGANWMEGFTWTKVRCFSNISFQSEVS